VSLAQLEEVRSYAGVETDLDDGLLQALIDRVEAAFLRRVNRDERPFQPAQPARVEIHDGTGSSALYLDYPVAALTAAITFGYASPWDTSLAPTDPAVVSFVVGSRRVVRIDGGTFGELGRPNYVRVTYDAAADQPEDVKLAITRVTAALWRESGGTEATAERTLPDTQDLPPVAEADPFWQAALLTHWQPRVG
jgi:hypothetical protein